MRILFVGDIFGAPGRQAVHTHVPRLREELRLDAVIANGENAAHGKGLGRKQAEEIRQSGVDVITLGDHAWDQREMLAHIEQDSRILRPANFPPAAPGKGVTVFETHLGKKIAVMNLIGRTFMEPHDDPFRRADEILETLRLGKGAEAILVDFHAEATSEKNAMGHYLDGRVSAVIGTHTHIPTADAWVLPRGTAYQTDAGMAGVYDSCIGTEKQIVIDKFRTRIPAQRFEPATGEATLCGAFIETDPATGLALKIQPVRRGGVLAAD